MPGAEAQAPLSDSEGGFFAALRVVGQLHRTYIVAEAPGQLVVIDQHAAHERVTFEGLKAQLREGRVEVQGLLVPEIVELSPSEMQLLEGKLELLGEIGIQLAPFGRSSLALHGLPALIRNPDAQALVHDLVEALERTGELPGSEELLEELLHRIRRSPALPEGLGRRGLHAPVRVVRGHRGEHAVRPRVTDATEGQGDVAAQEGVRTGVIEVAGPAGERVLLGSIRPSTRQADGNSILGTLICAYPR